MLHFQCHSELPIGLRRAKAHDVMIVKCRQSEVHVDAYSELRNCRVLPTPQNLDEWEFPLFPIGDHVQYRYHRYLEILVGISSARLFRYGENMLRFSEDVVRITHPKMIGLGRSFDFPKHSNPDFLGIQSFKGGGPAIPFISIIRKSEIVAFIQIVKTI